jgi:PAS domain S-box-containing protein
LQGLAQNLATFAHEITVYRVDGHSPTFGFLTQPESKPRIALKLPNASAIDRMPWYLRTLLGCGAALGSVGLTYAIPPLRAFPLLISFPAVILSAWFFGMAGSFGCAIVDSILVDIFLTKAQFRFSLGFAQQEERLGLFLILSTLVGVLIRRWAEQRAELNARELKKNLILERTQRQMAEERVRAGEALRDRDAALRIALRVSGMGLWTWDLQRGSVHWSDEVYRIMGFEPGAFPPENELWFRAVHPEDADAVKDGVAQVIESGKDFRREYRVVWPDGTVRWIESQGQCQRDADGHATWIMGVLTDVTQRKRAEEAMLRAEKLAVAGRLAASVAHEINNPLEAVTNLLYLITMSGTAEEAQAHARHALDELLRVSLITQSTLKFHRQQGMPKITMLSEVVEGVIALFRPRLNAAGITVDMRATNEVAIACMPSEAQQIFANLMANAIEATTQSGKLVIRLHPSRDWRNRIGDGMRVTICDSGVGMDRATLRRIFEPFFTTKPETGTGLGMWVVAQLVERHGGNIRVRSTQRYGASGTAFSIFLPTVHKSDAEGVEVESGTVPSVAFESTIGPIA